MAASAGLHLDGWQQYVLTKALGEKADGNWAATEVGLIVPRQNGKGSTLEARELFGLVLGGEKVIIHTAHNFKTCMEAFFRLKNLFYSTEDLRRRVEKTPQSAVSVGIHLHNGSRIDFVARSTGGGRGLTGDVIVLDEAFALEDKHIEALAPTLLARPNTQVWYTSSPPLDAATGEPLFKLRARAEAGDPNLAWFDWGQEPGANIDDPDVWRAANPATSSGRMKLESLAQARKQLSADGFGREVLGIWPATAGTQVISLDLWSQMVDSDAKQPSTVAFAVDVTPARDHSAIVMAGLRPDGTVLLDVVDHRPGTDWIAERLKTLKDRWKPVAIALDAKGNASSLLFDLRQAGLTETEDPEHPKAGDLVLADTSDAAAAFGMFVDKVRQKQVWHFDHASLNVALAGAKTRPCGDGGFAWGRRATKADISPLVAATLAHWAVITRANAEKPPAEPSIYWL